MNKFEREFLFKGLNPHEVSNKYASADRVAEDGSKCVARVSTSQLFATRFGYGLIVGHDKVVWLKNWQVLDDNWFTPAGTRDVVLTKEFYNVKQSSKEFDGICVGDCASDSDFEKENGYHSWQDMFDRAKVQTEYKF